MFLSAHNEGVTTAGTKVLYDKTSVDRLLIVPTEEGREPDSRLCATDSDCRLDSSPKELGIEP